MRLTLVTQDFPPSLGGIQTYAAALAEKMAPRCDYFSVIAPHRKGGDEIDRALPFPVFRLRGRDDLVTLPAMRLLPKLARRKALDITIHAQWQTALAARWSQWRTGYPKRIVVLGHGRELLFNPFPFPIGTIYGRLREGTYEAVDAFLANSQYTAGLMQELGISPHKITVIYGGTDPQTYRPQQVSSLRHKLGLEDNQVLFTIGRLVARKGVDTTLQALSRVVEERPRVVYLIGGTGPDQARLEQLAHTLGIARHVRFLGHLPDVDLVQYYNLADVFVMPSREERPDVEGLGVVFLEASACGTPVIGARSGGIPDAIADGETGLLVEPGDADELASRILHLLRRPDYAAYLGQQGRQRVLERFTWDHVASAAFDTLQRVNGQDVTSTIEAPVPSMLAEEVSG